MKNCTNHQTNTTSSSANIISVLQNITSGIKRKITKITDKDGSTTPSRKNITIASIIIILSIANITLFAGGNFGNTSDVSALSFSTSEDISFTFAPTLSIGLSTNNLTIDNLVPGTTSDSNTVTVTVSSNTPYGYVLSAGVGSNDTTSPYYNTSSLTHENTTISNVFSSVDTNASLDSLDTDNTWGYSTSTDGGTSWSTYSGLSHTETKPLLDMSDPAQPSTIDFKIAARSASTQASGAYNNVITFYAVGKPYVPKIDDLTYLQDFATISDTDKQAMIAATPTEVTYTLKDKRDDQDYTIAKLKDGKIWMTKNLNLAGGSIINSELSDVQDGYVLPVNNRFQPDNKLPGSSTRGFNDDTLAFIYNSTKTTGTDCSSPGCYSYYSWTAATAGSGLSISTDNTDAPYSICPKGWKLPSSRTTSASDWRTADFYQLAIAYGMDPSVARQSTSSFYTQAGPGTIPNFLLAGIYNGNNMFGFGNSTVHYWSSTSYNKSNQAMNLYFESSFVALSEIDSFRRRSGFPVRCLVK